MKRVESDGREKGVREVGVKGAEYGAVVLMVHKQQWGTL